VKFPCKICMDDHLMTDCGGTIRDLSQRVGEVTDYDSAHTSMHFNISSYDYEVPKSLDSVW
jgi:hypothetical protein